MYLQRRAVLLERPEMVSGKITFSETVVFQTVETPNLHIKNQTYFIKQFLLFVRRFPCLKLSN
jgi:hypothetical protein